MEGVGVNGAFSFWQGRRVLLTGHTGFKGSWLALWLQELGAEVTGFSLAPPTSPSLFEVAGVARGMTSVIGDIRDLAQLRQVMREQQPEVVFHLAAQALVRHSYADPVETYSTNVMGTVNVLEAVRGANSVRAMVNVTSDKCYENREWAWGYRENEALGGYDPYSNSKACAELVAASYRNSFFHPDRYAEHGLAVASARAGNVIGGGDWAMDRLVPDILRAIVAGQSVMIRNPNAIRPWQHVLEPLSGYLLLAQKLHTDGVRFGEGWNFGPHDSDAMPVRWLVDQLTTAWGEGASWQLDGADHPHEAHYLKLDCSKAKAQLGWQPTWRLDQTLAAITGWHRAHRDGADMHAQTLAQIRRFQQDTLTR